MLLKLVKLVIELMLLLVLVLAGLWAAGFRLHADVLLDKLADPNEKIYRKINLIYDSAILGKLVSETADGFILSLGDGTMEFKNMEIVSVEAVSKNDITSSPELQKLLFDRRVDRIITFDKEQSIFNNLDNLKDSIGSLLPSDKSLLEAAKKKHLELDREKPGGRLGS